MIRALKRGHGAPWQHQDRVPGEARLVERAFSLGPSGLADAEALLEEALSAAAEDYRRALAGFSAAASFRNPVPEIV